MKKILAIIPARGGSKRIPKKNIRSFFGKPIITYSIEAAKKAKLFEEIMVSTDDEEIAGIAKKLGATIPFLRSKNKAGDDTTLTDVIEEVLVKYKKMNTLFESLCCILPTAPFITSVQLMSGFSLLKKYRADSVIPVTPFSYPIQRAITIEKKRLRMIWPEHTQTNSQALVQTFHDAGLFYWIKTRSFLKQKKIFMKNTYPMIIPEYEAHDIDTEKDWKIAELKYKILCSKN